MYPRSYATIIKIGTTNITSGYLIKVEVDPENNKIHHPQEWKERLEISRPLNRQDCLQK